MRRLPGSAGTTCEWPEWVPAEIVRAWERRGVARPWTHQREAMDAAYHGRHVTLSTDTASGKSLAYLAPIAAATYGGPQACVGVATETLRTRLLLPGRQHTALYLAPTKALAHDQLRACRELGLPQWRVGALDGDSDPAERRFAREVATFVVSNPDMLHRSVLPRHDRWAGLLQSLRYVVVDEAHRYRGIFGAQVAQVLRRLRRLCAYYGAHPTFICASATSSDARASMARLIGVEDDDVVVIDADASRRPARDVVLWKPERGLYDDVISLFSRLVGEGQQTLTFVGSRAMAERTALRAAERLGEAYPVAAYRSGYLPGDRRSIEHRLQAGELRGVAATNALELGVDIAGMDAVVIAGFPGTLSALWQQAGRAGRSGRDALVVAVAKPDPLDEYLFDHPDLIFDAPVERTILHPDNPQVLGPHLCAAAQETTLRRTDESFFGPTMAPLADRLSDYGLLRKRPHGWFWTRPERAVDSIDLRSLGARPLDIVDTATGRVIGSVDQGAADRMTFPGAVYVHQGEQWLVDALHFDTYEVLVHRENPGYDTQSQSRSEISIIAEHERKRVGAGMVCRGEIEIVSQVTSYLRRDTLSGEVWDETPLELPEHHLRTQATWWLLPDALTAPTGLDGSALGSAAHGAEHCAIGLLPVFAPCDRWDIGGLSTVLHPDTGVCTVFVHDGQRGGGGFAEQGYARADEWLAATLERLDECACTDGCPRCVVSPKCGNANQMLDKAGARALLGAFLGR